MTQCLLSHVTAGHKIDCFECNSWNDARCKDPFNWTSHMEDMPPLVKCEGCRVKLVQKRRTPLESVRRTCTDRLDINLFMVDHVCMTEGGNTGHMCFCQEDDCNKGQSLHASSLFFVVSIFIGQFWCLVLTSF